MPFLTTQFVHPTDARFRAISKQRKSEKYLSQGLHLESKMRQVQESPGRARKKRAKYPISMECLSQSVLLYLGSLEHPKEEGFAQCDSEELVIIQEIASVFCE